MKVVEVYKKFGIPPNLQEHMLRVFEVTSYIEKHWKGETVDWDLAKKIALLHDLGNVVKFDFDKHPEFLGSEPMFVKECLNIPPDPTLKIWFPLAVRLNA